MHLIQSTHTSESQIRLSQNGISPYYFWLCYQALLIQVYKGQLFWNFVDLKLQKVTGLLGSTVKYNAMDPLKKCSLWRTTDSYALFTVCYKGVFVWDFYHSFTLSAMAKSLLEGMCDSFNQCIVFSKQYFQSTFRII